MILDHTKHLTPQEIEDLLKTIDELLTSEESRDKRDGALLLLAFETGARATECLMVCWHHVDFNLKTVKLRGLKGSKDRVLPISSKLCEAFKELGAPPVDDPYYHTLIFNFSYRWFKKIWDKRRPSAKKLHSLRHTRALEVFRKSKNIHITQNFLGHRSISSTMVYMDYCYNADELRNELGIE